ncbi:hypothetical protein GQ53DRAFT_498502 [Thozetella sp. PMI_491]|nr:hypothetical protein GQ53DRAFT_498502 [Thozetella sp. PMI_491]
MKYQLVTLAGTLPLAMGLALFPSRAHDAEIVNSVNAVVQLEPRHFQDLGSQRVMIKYGPFRSPSADVNSGMKSFEVMDAPVPCKDCLITFLRAGIEFADGSYANANTSMWLHHVVVANQNRRSVSCPNMIEFMFAAGNERSPVDLTLNGTRKAGYYIKDGDKLSVFTDLMNESNEARDVVLTLEWEFVPSAPPDFEVAVPIWLDIDGACLPHAAEVPVPKNEATFSFVMDPPWTANFSAKTLMVMNHIHDGGSNILVTKNGQTYCDGKAKYGESSGYISGMGGMDMSGHSMSHDMGMKHISSISGCSTEELIQPGDKWSVKANYNLTEHAPMIEANNVPAPIMGIGVLYVVKG